jgi:hypothetical protein
MNDLNFKSFNSSVCYVSYLNHHRYADASGASNDVYEFVSLKFQFELFKTQ